MNMEAVILSNPAVPTIEVNGKSYVEDLRGRLVPIEQYDEVRQDAGKVEINGQMHVQDATGRWMDWRLVTPTDQLQDEVVRKIIAFARDLSAQITRFRRHTEEDLASFVELLQQEYGATIGGKAGNMMIRTFDDLQRVSIKVGKFMEFGPELLAAKTLIDEYLRELTSDAPAELKLLILGAFEVDKKGKLDRQKILALKKYAITDQRWQRAMKAISDADRTMMVREYLHFHFRTSHRDEFKAITINLAKA